MRKKYLSALLFGALLFASAGTFTSCKDYDDDINNLQEQINTINTTLSELKTLVGDGGVSSVTFDESTGVLTVVDANGTKAYTIKTAAGSVDEVKITIEGQELKVNGVTVGKVGDAVAVENGELTINGAATGIKVGEYSILDNQDAGTVTITLPDADGKMQTVVLMKAGAVLSYINVINAGVEGKNVKFEALYDINDADVTYSPYDRTLKAGLYTTLDRDLKIVVNPQSADASIYKFALKNSNGDDTELTFKPAQAYEGSALTADEVTSRASSKNGIWVLENDYTRYDNNNLTDIRTNLYKKFKANDVESPYALTLQATNEGTTFNTPYDLSAELRQMKNTTAEALDMQYTHQGEWVKPVVVYHGDESAVYDYWLTLEQSASNLQKAELYGVKISDDGYTFSFNRETAVGNEIKFVYNYILVNGTIYQGQTGTNQGDEFTVKFAEEMANVTTTAFPDLIKPFDAELASATYVMYTGEAAGAGNGFVPTTNTFFMTKDDYDFTEFYNGLSDANKLVWNAAIETLSTTAEDAVSFELFGGEGGNNADNNNADLLKNIRYKIDNTNKKIGLQFLVDEALESMPNGSDNFKLNTAYELVMTVKDPIANNVVAQLTFPFELQQPTLDIIHTKDKWTVWTTDQNGHETLTSYGAYGKTTVDPNNAVKMYLPLYEAFQAWTTEHTVYDNNAKYYQMMQDDASDVTLLGKGQNVIGKFESDLKYSTSWNAWNTTVADATVTYNSNGDEVERSVLVQPEFKHYGVYEEPKVKDFTLKFASLLNHSSLKMADGKETLVVNTGTHDVFISNDILNLMTPMEGKFFLFDGIDADGKVVVRKTLNEASFNEEQRGFMTVDEIFNVANFSAKAKTGSTTYNNFINAGKAGWAIDAQTGKLSYTIDTPDADEIKIYQVDAAAKRPAVSGEVIDPTTTMVGAHTGGIVIQLPTAVADQEEVEITLTIEDGLGFTNDLKFTVKKIQ